MGRSAMRKNGDQYLSMVLGHPTPIVGCFGKINTVRNFLSGCRRIRPFYTEGATNANAAK
jgi:hypothetical protein